MNSLVPSLLPVVILLASVLPAMPIPRNNPNAYTGTDSDRIEQALSFACANAMPLVITPRVPVGNDRRAHWLIDRAILLPGGTEVRLDDCTIQLSDQCRDNFFRSANCRPGTGAVHPIAGIRIRGRGHAILRGAEHPRATGDSGTTLGKDTFGTDAGKPGECPVGDWRNIGILLADVSDFTIEGIAIVNSHCWAISLEYCSHGMLRDLRFASLGVMLIDGRPQTTLNQDGIDLRQGCRHIAIERISGWTGDDLIALTAIGTTDETRPAGAFGSTHFSASKRRGEGDDIHHITIRDVHGYSAGNCQIVRLLNTRGVKLHDILIERVHDCSARALHNRAVLRIGDRNPHWGGPNPIGDTARIIARGIVSNAQAAIVIQGSLADSTIEDVRLRRNKLGLVELLNQEYLRDVRLPQVP